MRYFRKMVDGSWKTIKLSVEEQREVVAKTIKTNVNRVKKSIDAVEELAGEKGNAKYLKLIPKEKMVELVFGTIKESVGDKTNDFIEKLIEDGLFDEKKKKKEEDDD